MEAHPRSIPDIFSLVLTESHEDSKQRESAPDVVSVSSVSFSGFEKILNIQVPPGSKFERTSNWNGNWVWALPMYLDNCI